jgi:hypothetical protein
MSAQEIAEKYGLSLEGIQQFSSSWAKDEVATERKVPRWMAWRSMIPNQTSTRFSNDPELGGGVDLDPGVARQPAADLDAFAGGGSVHHQVQLAVGCRFLQSPVTFLVAISTAANSIVVPYRT